MKTDGSIGDVASVLAVLCLGGIPGRTTRLGGTRRILPRTKDAVLEDEALGHPFRSL